MFDGPDGVGKTTQIELVSADLRQQGRSVFLSRINGGSEFGEKLRDVVLSETPRQSMSDHYVFMAMHTELRHELVSRLGNGDIILMDRSPLSNWAYQKFGGEITSPEFDRDIDTSMSLFNADLIICYSATLPTIRQRMSQQTSKADYFDSKSDDYFRKVIDGYDFAAKRYNATVIDAEHSVEQVHADTMQAITAVLDDIG